MKNHFESFIGIETVSFGLKREDIRNSLNQKFQPFLRNQFAVNTSDYYEDLGYFVEYNADEICEAIEFTDESNVYLNGVNLVSLGYDELRTKYDPLSNSIDVEEGFGVTYHDLGFGVSTEFHQNKIETVIIFSKEYWG